MSSFLENLAISSIRQNQEIILKDWTERIIISPDDLIKIPFLQMDYQCCISYFYAFLAALKKKT